MPETLNVPGDLACALVESDEPVDGYRVIQETGDEFGYHLFFADPDGKIWGADFNYWADVRSDFVAYEAEAYEVPVVHYRKVSV